MCIKVRRKFLYNFCCAACLIVFWSTKSIRIIYTINLRNRHILRHMHLFMSNTMSTTKKIGAFLSLIFIAVISTLHGTQFTSLAYNLLTDYKESSVNIGVHMYIEYIYAKKRSLASLDWHFQHTIYHLDIFLFF